MSRGWRTASAPQWAAAPCGNPRDAATRRPEAATWGLGPGLLLNLPSAAMVLAGSVRRTLHFAQQYPRAGAFVAGERPGRHAMSWPRSLSSSDITDGSAGQG